MPERCCVVDQKRKKCVDIDFDDSHCAEIAKCCVGIHNFGEHKRCMDRLRECRKLGNAWDPIAPLRPLPVEFLYTERPGYSTTGVLVENFNAASMLDQFFAALFDVECLVKNSVCSLVIALVAKAVLEQKISTTRLVVLTLAITLVKCCAAKL